MRLFFTFLYFLIISNTLISYSQNSILKDVVPPLPETASLNQGYSARMNGYQGNLSFNVPVFTIVEDGLNIPISLIYASNSNKVRDRASRVGLGWTLFAGGMVSRSIRDLPDENPNGFLECFKCNEQFEENLSVRQRMLSKVGHNRESTFIDLEPDLYHFNFLDYSGKFIIDNSTYKAIVQENNDLKIDIEFESGTKKVQKLVFTDIQGNKYYFGMTKDNTKNAYEKFQKTEGYSYDTKSFTTNIGEVIDQTSNSIVGWALLEIELSNKEKVVFDYTKQYVRYQSISSVSVPSENSGKEIIGYNTTTGNELVLQKISFSQGETIFDYDPITREDLFGSRALKGIKVLDNNRNLVTEILLEHYYTNHTNRSNVIPGLDLDNTSYKRLIFKNIKQYNKESKLFEDLYQFEYNSIALPSIHSTSVDVWGYFNNENNSVYLFNNNYTKHKINSQYSQASLLEKVKLNTSGYIKYSYESNSFKMPQYYKNFHILGLEYIESIIAPPDQKQEFVNMYKSISDYDNIDNYFKKDFEINEKSLSVYAEVNYFPPPGCENKENYNCIYEVQIRDINNKILYSGFNQGKIKVKLNNGKYKIIVIPKRKIDMTDFGEDHFAIRISWDKFNNNDINNFINQELAGPGSRIKRINYYNDTDQEESYVEYKYKGKDNKSSGKIFSIPDFLLILRYKDLPSNILVTRGSLFDFNILHGKVYDSSPINMFNTNDYGYEIIEEFNDISKIRREYTIFKDAGEYYIYPFHLPIDLSWTRGKLLSETFYKKNGEDWILEKQINNKYQFYNETTHPFAWSTGNTFSIASNDETMPIDSIDYSKIKLEYSVRLKKVIFPLYKFHHYMDISNPDKVEDSYYLKDPNRYRKSYFVGGTMNLINQETTLYEGNTSIITKENFSYNSPNHNQVTQSNVVNTIGDNTTTTYKYASDITGSTIASQMTQQNILSNYIESEVFLNQNRILKETNDFKNIGNNIIKLNSKKTEKANSTLVNTLYSINYDNKANISEVLNSDNAKTTLLYGYNSSLLIAKIENASKEEVANALGVNVINLHTIDESKLTQINNLRSNASLKEASITTYEHKPLIGVTKITDSKGEVLLYEYDGFNRFKWIKDSKGNKLKEYEYNYKSN